MRNIGTKVDGTDVLSGDEFNSDQNELENIVTSADITLDADTGPDTNLNMLSEAVAAYANAGNVYQDSGAADAYVLSLTTNLKSVTKYYDNMMIVGDIRKESLRDIWQGEKMEEWREKIRDGDYTHPLCDVCFEYAELEGR